MFNDTQGILADDKGSVFMIYLDESGEKFVESVICGEDSGNSWMDAVYCKALGGIILASTTFSLSVVFENGQIRRLAQTEPLANKRQVLVRTNPSGNSLALNIFLRGFEAVKVYNQIGEFNFTDPVIIKPFPHNKEEFNDDMVNEMKFLGEDKLVIGTSRGELSIWDLEGKKLQAVKLFDWTQDPKRIDNIVISHDQQFAIVLTSTGTMTLRTYTLNVVRIGEEALEVKSTLDVREGARGMWLSHCFKSGTNEQEKIVMATNDHRDIRFYKISAEGDEITWVHEDESMDFGEKFNLFQDNHVWTVDEKYNLVKTTVEPQN